MSAEFAEGLRLAGAGMGLVFATLVALMVILFALGRFFPGEEAEEAVEVPDTHAPAAQDEAAAPVAEPPAPIEAAAAPATGSAPVPQPDAIAAPARDGVPGSKVAALAVAVYLAMEQEEAERAGASPTPSVAAASQADTQPSQPTSNWGILGRAALWQSQGRRPSAYGHRAHSAY
ncbi:MAG: hypothetical protein OXP10_02705, partial [Chloroflexota bacterium]|nr:hypothetical protein [Chloroflexota bacterium]